MTLREIREALPEHAHPLTPSNITAVELDAHGLWVEIDTSELEEELAVAKEETADLAKQNAARVDDVFRLETAENREKAGLIREAEQARELARRHAQARQETERELTLLRQRKGVMPGYVAHAREVMRLLSLTPEGANLVQLIRNHTKP